MTLKDMRELVSHYPEAYDGAKILVFREQDEVIENHWTELDIDDIMVGPPD
jgi:hypothetical protein